MTDLDRLKAAEDEACAAYLAAAKAAKAAAKAAVAAERAAWRAKAAEKAAEKAHNAAAKAHHEGRKPVTAPKTLAAAWSPPRPDVNSSGEVIAHYRDRDADGWRYTQRRLIGGRWEDVSTRDAAAGDV